MPRIDRDRLLGDLQRLRAFGAYETGVHRPTFTPEDMAARHWFAGRLEEAGLAVTMDGIGNILGRSSKGGPAMLTGSHLESQNRAGWLDGALGCVFGLEAARAIAEDAGSADLPVDVVVVADEEGHYGSFLGSRSFIGILEEAEIDAAANRYHGKPLRDALAEAGLAGRPRLAVEPGRYRGFIEAHIEQGDRLESAGLKIAVVTAIVAIWQYRITVEGEQNHAGTTSMTRRRDAGLALTRLLAAIDREFPGIAGPASVWTTGRITLEPGAPSIIPGRAEALFQFRDADPAVLERMDATLRRLVAEADAGPCPTRLEVLGQSRPALMDEGLLAAIEAAAAEHAPGLARRMPSGAGHDAQYLARVMPAAMLFVPSIGGISHHWTENTSDDDIALGGQVYADAVANALAAS
jgi:beta-ureidopropionase / N-carbamoyl-L-amino-acid hydrolase